MAAKGKSIYLSAPPSLALYASPLVTQRGERETNRSNGMAEGRLGACVPWVFIIHNCLFLWLLSVSRSEKICGEPTPWPTRRPSPTKSWKDNSSAFTRSAAPFRRPSPERTTWGTASSVITDSQDPNTFCYLLLLLLPLRVSIVIRPYKTSSSSSSSYPTALTNRKYCYCILHFWPSNMIPKPIHRPISLPFYILILFIVLLKEISIARKAQQQLGHCSTGRVAPTNRNLFPLSQAIILTTRCRRRQNIFLIVKLFVLFQFVFSIFIYGSMPCFCLLCRRGQELWRQKQRCIWCFSL